MSKKITKADLEFEIRRLQEENASLRAQIAMTERLARRGEVIDDLVLSSSRTVDAAAHTITNLCQLIERLRR